jgi:hypothetical protein
LRLPIKDALAAGMQIRKLDILAKADIPIYSSHPSHKCEGNESDFNSLPLASANG